MSVTRNISLLSIAAAVAILAACACADIVYLKNGNSYEGKVVSRTDKEVVVNVRGKEVKLLAEDVLHIKFDKPAAPPDKPPSPGQPTKPGPAAPGQPQTAQPPIKLEQKPFRVEDATMPEPVIFSLMRNLATTPPGSTAFEIRQQIDRWRIEAHDRKRRVGANWATPKEFAGMRAAYEDLLKEAQALAATAVRGRPGSRGYKRDRTKWSGAMAKLRQAAHKWPDSLLREYLVGLAALPAEDYAVAAERFRACAEAAPRVAGFRQAHGTVQLELKQHIPAVVEFTDVLRLLPGSRDAMKMLRDAMRQTPGGLTKEQAYVTAGKLLAEYEPPPEQRYLRRGDAWLMPGRQWYVSDRTLLPTPPYDRLIFRQGVAVPVDKQTLAVDAKTVKDAEEVFVRLAPGLIVGATVGRSSYLGSRPKEDPLAFVHVEGVEFTPLRFDKASRGAAGMVVTVYGISLYEELGGGVRAVGTTIKSVAEDGTPTLGAGLLAGEAAAPVVAGDGRLVAFLAGKTDVKADDGGKSLAMPMGEITGLIEQGRRQSSIFRGYGRVKRKASAPAYVAAGQAFVVYATAVEKLE